MKCHYEVLGIEQDADDGDIKKSYRKLALRWHPDKNLSDPETAKEKFLYVQQAYEVLSDPHERAFYDKHRDQILRGKNSKYEENSLDLFQYFTVSCFKGYGDDPAGFYEVYGKIFETLASEDAEFMDDEEDIEDIPKFGNSKSSYEDVVAPFYAYWQSYCTKKTYSWLCPYDITEMKDRRILREIEKETKKIAQKAKKERNEEVRNLVSFIRKRDKRVQANKKLLEEKAAANRKKQEQNRLDQIRKRQKEVEEMKKNQSKSMVNDGYEDQLRQLEEEYSNSDEWISSEEDDGLENITEELADLEFDLYCVACNKSFRNQNAFLNHEDSKQHRKNVEQMKLEMEEEERILQEAREADEENSLNEDDGEEIEVVDELNENEEADEEEEEEIEEVTKKASKKKKKGRKSQVNVQIESEPEEEISIEFLQHKDDNWEDDKKNKKSKNKKTNQKKGKIVEETTNETSPETKIPDKSEDKAQKKSESEKLPVTDLDHVCVTCKSQFDSKNKLFAHLKKTKHGVYLPKKGTPEVASGKKNKKK